MQRKTLLKEAQEHKLNKLDASNSSRQTKTQSFKLKINLQRGQFYKQRAKKREERTQLQRAKEQKEEQRRFQKAQEISREYSNFLQEKPYMRSASAAS